MSEPRKRAAPEIQRLPTEIPKDLVDASGDRVDLLIGYQKRLLETTAICRVVVVEKSRRIGYTWAIAADASLVAATDKAGGGMDVLYIGYNLDMAREFIDVCGAWSRLFDRACTEISEFMFEDGEPDKAIKAFRITFASGHEIVALASRPRSLRGRQGYVIIDEAAFHDDLDELVKAALALLIWGGKVVIISTHDGIDNPFNKLIEDCRAGKRPFEVLRITFDDALADGLFKRICLVKGEEWTAEKEAAFKAEIVAFYGDGADEELFCAPRTMGGSYIPRPLIERQMRRGVPVLRYAVPPSFVDLPETETKRIVLEWCEANLKPHLDQLDKRLMHYFAQDFGRSGDLSVMWPLALGQDLVRRTPFVVELRNVPFEEQKLITNYIIQRLPRFMVGAFDAGGNGASHAEAARRKYGADRIHEIKLTAEFYRIWMPKFKAGFEMERFELPADADIRVDLQAIAMENGVAKVPANAHSKGADGGQRHGDAGIAGFLAWFCSEQPRSPIEFESIGVERPHAGLDDFVRGY